MAYHNLGVEQEFLKQFSEARMSYIQATEFAEKYLGKDDGIYRNLSAVQRKFEEEYEKQQSRKHTSHNNNRAPISPVRGASPPQKRAITATKGPSGMMHQ